MISATGPLDYRQIFLRAISGGTLIYLCSACLSFLVGIQLARGLGIEAYGLYGSVMAIVSLGAAVASGGWQLLATRNVASSLAHDDAAAARRLLLWSIKTVLPLSILVAVVVGIATWGLLDTGWRISVAGMILLGLVAFLALTAAFVRGVGKIVLGMALDNVVRPAIYAILLASLVLLAVPLTVNLAMTLAAVAAVCTIAIGGRSLLNLLQEPIQPGSDQETAVWRHSALKLSITAVLRMVEATVPLILIGAWTTLSDAGAFRVAATVATLAAMAASMIRVIVPAMLSNLHAHGDERRMRRLVAAAAIVMTLPTLLLVGLFYAVGEPLISMLFGADFVTAWLPAMILMGAAAVAAMGGVSLAMLQLFHSEHTVNIAFGISIAVMAVSAILMIPAFGATGAAVSFTAGTLARTVYISHACYRKTSIDPTIFGAMLEITGFSRSGKNA